MPPSRTPLLLQPYTRLPTKDSLILLTSVLGASTNWLVIRFLCGALSSAHATKDGGDGVGRLGDEFSGAREEEGESAVVLVSWMRDWEFWRAEGRKAGGLDLARLTQQRRFAFVDGLTHLFMPPVESPPSASPAMPQRQQTTPPHPSPLPLRAPRTIPLRAPLVPGRQPAPGTPTPAASRPTAATTTTTTPTPSPPQSQFKLTSPSLHHTETVIQQAIAHITAPSPGKSSPKKVLLVLDNPDLLLAAARSLPTASPSQQDRIDAPALLATLLHLRQHVHAAVVAMAADAPLVAPSSSLAAASLLPLETRHAALVVGVGHVAAWTMGLRLLDTGVAADVSGVVRITRGDVDLEDGEEGEWEKGERELLYFVGGDGGVRVFERGSGVGVG